MDGLDDEEIYDEYYLRMIRLGKIPQPKQLWEWRRSRSKAKVKKKTIGQRLQKGRLDKQKARNYWYDRQDSRYKTPEDRRKAFEDYYKVLKNNNLQEERDKIEAYARQEPTATTRQAPTDRQRQQEEQYLEEEIERLKGLLDGQSTTRPEPSDNEKKLRTYESRLADLRRGTGTQPTQEIDFDNEQNELEYVEGKFSLVDVKNGDKTVRRRPIRLRELLNWGQSHKSITQWLFCERLARLRLDGIASTRIISGYKRYFLSNWNQLGRMYQLREHPQQIASGLAKPFVDIKLFDFKDYSDEDKYEAYRQRLQSGEIKPAVLMDGEQLQLTFGEKRYAIVGQADYFWNGMVGKVYNGLSGPLEKDGKVWLSRKQLMELLCLMKLYNTTTAHVFSHFDPVDFTHVITSLLKTPFAVDSFVYKPWYNYEEDRIATIIYKPRSKIWKALSTTYLAKYNARRKTNLERGPRDIYERLETFINDAYDKWIVNELGEAVLDVAMHDKPNASPNSNARINPLRQLELIDQTFTNVHFKQLLDNINQQLQDSTLRYDDGAAIQFTNPPASAVAAAGAFVTETIRDVKRGKIVETTENGWIVAWEVPKGIVGNQAPIRQTVTDDALRTMHQQVASFLLKKQERFYDNTIFQSAEETTFSNDLRQGNQTINNDTIQYIEINMKKAWDNRPREIRLQMSTNEFQEAWDMLKTFFILIEKECQDDPTGARIGWKRIKNKPRNTGYTWEWQGSGPEPDVAPKNLPEEIEDLMRAFDAFFEADNEQFATKFIQI